MNQCDRIKMILRENNLKQKQYNKNVVQKPYEID